MPKKCLSRTLVPECYMLTSVGDYMLYPRYPRWVFSQYPRGYRHELKALRIQVFGSNDNHVFRHSFKNIYYMDKNSHSCVSKETYRCLAYLCCSPRTVILDITYFTSEIFFAQVLHRIFAEGTVELYRDP